MLPSRISRPVRFRRIFQVEEHSEDVLKRRPPSSCSRPPNDHDYEISSASENIECPLCPGEGELSRAEILDRLGVKDFARVAQLSAEEAFRLLQNRHDREHQNAWSRFETELAKRTAEISERHKDELRTAQSERDDLTRRVEDCLREVGSFGNGTRS